MPKVTEEHREAVRRRLVDAARRVLLRRGYDLTTREILAEADLSAGTLYNYFPSKADLVEAVAEDVLAEDVSLFSAIAESDGRGTGPALVDLVRDWVLAEPHPGTAVLAQFRGRVTQEPEVRSAVGRYNRSVVDAFRPLVEAAAAEGFLRDDVDPAGLIELIDIVWDGMARRAATDTFATDFETVAAACVRVLLGGAVRDVAAVPAQPPPGAPASTR